MIHVIEKGNYYYFFNGGGGRQIRETRKRNLKRTANSPTEIDNYSDSLVGLE